MAAPGNTFAIERNRKSVINSGGGNELVKLCVESGAFQKALRSRIIIIGTAQKRVSQ
jgi:hypothetical protein